jgi:hypothetical protein
MSVFESHSLVPSSVPLNTTKVLMYSFLFSELKAGFGVVALVLKSLML